MWLALLLAEVRATCPPAPLAFAVENVGELRAAYAHLDDVAFDRAASALVEAIPCIAEPIPEEVLIELHYAMGLRAFGNQDTMGAQRSLAAVRELEPAWRPNERSLDPGSAMFAWYELVIPRQVIALAAEPPGGWLVDGRPESTIPGHRAFVLQALGRHGEVSYSGYHSAPSSLPAFDFPAQRIRRTVRVGGSIGAGTLAVGGVVTQIAAASVRGSVDEPGTTPEERLARYERSSALQTVAIGLFTGGGVVAGATWAIPW